MRNLLTLAPTFEWKSVVKKYAPVLMIAVAVLLVTQFACVDYSCADIWEKGQNTAKDIYDNVRTLSTYIAGVMFIIALAISFFSKDQRKVDAALDWAKRIFIIYLVIMAAGWIFEYGRELTSDAPSIFGDGN